MSIKLNATLAINIMWETRSTDTTTFSRAFEIYQTKQSTVINAVHSLN